MMAPRGAVRIALIALAAAALASPASVALAAPAAAPPGAASCSGCHAPAGTHATAIPSAQDLTAAEIEAAMLAYKSGDREATVMDRIARGFSEQEIAEIAAWLGQRK